MKNFSVSSYTSIIRSFLDHGYHIIPLEEKSDTSNRIVHLRHDVDYSLELAVRMAEINHDLGVRGCFFIFLRNPVYNPTAYNSRNALERLRELNQSLGLHFDLLATVPSVDPQDRETVYRSIQHDFELLQTLIGENLEKAVSWHNPSVLGDQYRDLVQSEVPGLVNANSLAGKGIVYMADSNHRHSVQAWLETAESGPRHIQALFHPFQWILGAPTMRQVLAKVWFVLIRENERLFLTNHVYRELLPEGLPDDAVRTLLKPLSRKH